MKFRGVALLVVYFIVLDAIAAPLRLGGSPQGIKLEDKLIVHLLKSGGTYDVSYPLAGTSTFVPISAILQGAKNEEIDVFWTMTNPELEEEFIPIRIPIYRGLLGMRVVVVKKENGSMLKDVESVEDLKKYTAGQGKLWTDTKILEANGLSVVKELKYVNTFRMLEADRFDYYPRGINEAWNEVRDRPELGLVVDDSILIWYQVPFYFFVSKNKPKVAEHLKKQFEAIVADGSFLRLFYQDELIQSGLKNVNFAGRTIIRLNNPLLTPETPVERGELWFDPQERYDSVTEFSQ